MILYKLGNFLHLRKVPVLPQIINGLIRIIHNCAIYSETTIGKGTLFGYGGIGVVIHKNAIIGKNCRIGTNVTIGGRSKSPTVPVIGDDVYIATGAKVLGGITIGNNCVVGANAVVISSVADNTMVAGIPAKVLKQNIIMEDFR